MSEPGPHRLPVGAASCFESPGDCTCSFCSLIEVLARKWTLHMVGFLARQETFRFNELKRRLDGISPRTLSARLLELEQMGLVERMDHGGTPPKVEYRLTAKGRDLQRIYESFLEWAGRWGVALDEFPAST